MKLQIIAEAPGSLQRKGRSYARRALEDHVRDPDAVFDLMTTHLATYDQILFAVDEWWRAMAEQWLMVDESTFQTFYKQTADDFVKKTKSLGLATEGIISDLFGLFKKALAFAVRALLQSQGGYGGYGKYSSPRDTARLKMLNGDIAGTFVQRCLAHSQKQMEKTQAQQTQTPAPTPAPTPTESPPEGF